MTNGFIALGAVVVCSAILIGVVAIAVVIEGLIRLIWSVV